MRKIKQNKAITLIALIITIIVLLILAGVIINFTVGNQGIINKAQTAVGKYENAQEKENSVFIEYEKNIDNYRENVGFGESNLITSISVKCIEINGKYVTVEVTADNLENIRGYGIILNDELVRVSENKKIVVPNLSLSTTYRITGYAIDKKNNIKKSQEISFKTLEHQYLYKNGLEFISLTGGWNTSGNAYKGWEPHSGGNTGNTRMDSYKGNNYMSLGPNSSTNSPCEYSELDTNSYFDISNYSSIHLNCEVNSPRNNGMTTTYFMLFDNQETLVASWDPIQTETYNNKSISITNTNNLAQMNNGTFVLFTYVF